MGLYAIPSGRIGVYDSNALQGVVGGLPDYPDGVNIMDYGADDTGVADSTTALSNARAASSPDTAIVIPEGNFKMSAGAIYWQTNRIVIRGVDPLGTVIKPTGVSGLILGTGIDWTDGGNPTSVITGGLTRGSTTITVTDGSTFTNGKAAKIIILNEPATPVLHVYGYKSVRSFVTYVVSKSGNNLTIFPPIQTDFPYTTGAKIYQSQLNTQTLCGIENLTVDCGDSGGATQNGFSMEGNTYQCWFKNVRSRGHTKYGIKLADGVNFECRTSYVEPGYLGSSNTAGMLANTMTNMLFEDNVIDTNNPAMELNGGTIGSVIAANYCNGRININHGPHNSCNLYTQNKVPYIETDGYFAGNSEDTIFGNHVYGTTAYSVKRFSRNLNSVGNLHGSPGIPSGDTVFKLGDPNIGNEISNGTAEHSTGDTWFDYDLSNSRPKRWTGVLTTRTSDSAGVVTLSAGQAADLQASLDITQGGNNWVRGFGWGADGNQFIINFVTVSSVVGDVVTFYNASTSLPIATTDVTLWPGPAGFQEKDLDVENTLLRKANYYYNTSEMPSGELISPDTLPVALHRSSKPAYFGSKDWPPYDPFNPSTGADGRIPAEDRFNAGTTPAAPAFYLDPTSRTVTEGANTTFTAAASGTPTPTYQWKKGGVDISGATSASYTITGVVLGDAGSYTCVATNSEGTDTSAAAILTVNAASVSSTPQPRRRSASFGFGFTLL